MTLLEIQWEFLNDVAALILFIDDQGYSASGGELFRTEAQQKIYIAAGKSKRQDSLHLSRLAIDIHIFREGKLITELEELRIFGEYWERLNEENRAGMFWKFYDACHFERRLLITDDKKNPSV